MFKIGLKAGKDFPAKIEEDESPGNLAYFPSPGNETMGFEKSDPKKNSVQFQLCQMHHPLEINAIFQGNH